MKAYELARKIMEMAFDGFREIFQDVLWGKVSAVPQNREKAEHESDKLHYSYEVPGNGIFSLKDSAQDIYRLLRAVDYGFNQIFPNVKCTLYDEVVVEITAYKKVLRQTEHTDSVVDETNRIIYISLDEKYDLRLKYRR